jgi:hypothetical protein
MGSEMIAKLLVRASRDDQRLNVLAFCFFAAIALLAWILK